MAVKVTMPKWGLTMKEGKITRWFKSEGDTIAKGEPLFEVETEKITNIVESAASGVLFQIVIAAGTTVPVGTILAVIAEEGEQPERIEDYQPGEVAEAPAPSSPRRAPTEAKRSKEKKFVRSSPAARRLSKELGVDLAMVKGTGPEGRIIEEDVRRYHEQGPSPPKMTPLAAEMIRQAGLDASQLEGTGENGKITQGDVERFLEVNKQARIAQPIKSIPFEGMRKSIAANMRDSLQHTAQLTIFTEVDVTEMVRFRDVAREKYKQDETVRVSYNDIVIMATARALKQYPMMNSTLVGDEILIHDSVHMGVAVALPEGLIVPVLMNADKLDLLQIAYGTRELARKAREGTLTVDEVTGGTFTVSNLSMFEVDGVTPILKPPETGILGVGRVKEKPAVHNGEITIRTMMFLCLTFDHQVVDGAPASEFLGTVAQYLENPYLMMI